MSVNFPSWNSSDSPGIPPSAHAHELFRGFSFIAPALLENEPVPQAEEIIANHISLAKVCEKLH